MRKFKNLIVATSLTICLVFGSSLSVRADSYGGTSGSSSGESHSWSDEDGNHNESSSSGFGNSMGNTTGSSKNKSSSSGTWKSDANGWWYQNADGTYPKNTWKKINGNWYYFLSNGYMDYSEYRDGCWLNANGTWNTAYSHGTWKKDSKGWWYEDNGWYPVNQTLWIDGVQYYFDSTGYLYTEYDNSNGDFWTKKGK